MAGEKPTAEAHSTGRRGRVASFVEGIRHYHHEVWFTTRGRQILVIFLLFGASTNVEMLLAGRGYTPGMVLGNTFAFWRTVLNGFLMIAVAMSMLYMMDLWEEEMQSGDGDGE